MNPSPFTIPGSAAIWLAFGWSVAGLGLFLLLWALFKDRAKGRLRCPKCWYDMSGARASEVGGAIDLRCPECGHDARTVKRLKKTRRKWRCAFVALVMMLVGGAASAPALRKIQKDGWWSVVPERLLVELVSLRGWRNPGVSGAPENELASRCIGALLSDRAICRLLDEASEVRIRAPERWLWNDELPIAVSSEGWAPSLIGIEWRLVGSWSREAPLSIRDVARRIPISGLKLVLPLAGALPSRHEELTCWLEGVTAGEANHTVTLEAFRPASPGVVLWSLKVPLTTTFARHIAEILTPISPAELRGVRLRARIMPRHVSGYNVDAFSIELPDDASDDLRKLVDSTIFALRAEFIENGQVVAVGHTNWSRHLTLRHGAREWVSAGDSVSLLGNNWNPKRLEGFTVRITTDTEALRPDWQSSRYWSGELILGLDELVASAECFGSEALRITELPAKR